jgi:hypothetical protein
VSAMQGTNEWSTDAVAESLCCPKAALARIIGKAGCRTDQSARSPTGRCYEPCSE